MQNQGRSASHVLLANALAYWSFAAGCSLVAIATSGRATYAQPASAPDLAKAISKRLDDHLENAEIAERPLRVVYFHPADVKPFEDYEERLTRIVLDIQEFYRGEMKRNGFGPKTFPLEMANNNLVLHVVKGKRPADDYTKDSGDQVEGEIEQALAQKFDLASEHVLVVNAMCKKREDGSYLFHAPYHGSGGAKSGICHVADCELMDTLHFKETEKRIRYTEMNGTRDQTLADFCCLYIGGIAHELGHAFGYQHNTQKPWERMLRGTALMGAGNYTYRHELRGRRGSFMTFATSMQLASHPLFTNTRTGLDQSPETKIEELKFSQQGRSLVVTGKIDTEIEAYAVIGFTNPQIEKGWLNRDYDSLTWNCEVKDGEFSIVAKINKPGRSGLKIRFCHLNGKQSSFKFEYAIDDKGVPSAASLNDDWQVQRVELTYLNGDREEATRLATNSLPNVTDDKAKAKLEHVAYLTAERKPIELAEVKANEAHLSESQWQAAAVGWGKPARDQYYSDSSIRDGVFLELGNTFYDRGLYAHAPSRYEFDLSGSWKKFEATAGLQKGVAERGSGIFIIKGDGQVLYTSKLLKGNATDAIQLDVGGVESLELIVESGKQGNGNCWTIWGGAKVTR
ncbi:MAG: NPCBM/NEW2 domain-containing protein [Planctomycetes bacterium]|nr:NPCBM/NEW2 domain-containing protein [Planctomycetota bacterium]